MNSTRSAVLIIMLALAGCGGGTAPEQAAQPAAAPKAAAKPHFDVAWAHYTGWEPWGYARHPGRPTTRAELSVSHYLWARALALNGMKKKDVKLVTTSDADIASVYTADANGAAVTWNPPLMQARQAPGTTLVFDSSKIPGEIMDLMVVRTDAPD